MCSESIHYIKKRGGAESMLKIVGTGDHQIVDERIIIDDNNKITPFGFKLMLTELVLDLSLLYLIGKIVKKVKK